MISLSGEIFFENLLLSERANGTARTALMPGGHPLMWGEKLCFSLADAPLA